MTNSVCIFHNGNYRVVNNYRKKFSNLEFRGNWACNEFVDDGLYEIYYADATLNVMLDLKKKNVRVIRHISAYNDDIMHPIDNCNNSLNWIDNITNFLCFSDEIYSDADSVAHNNNSKEHAIITTGRTASTHYRYYLNSQNIISYEYDKLFDQRLIDSKSGTLLWRKNSWECATSIYIAVKNDNFIHNHNGENTSNVFRVEQLDLDWFKTDWLNLSQLVLNHALLYKFFLKKPIDVKITEDIICDYKTSSNKIQYNKEELIANYSECKFWYDNNVDSMLDALYTNTKKLIEDNQ